MITRRFGRTEIPMPVITLGGMRFQHKWQDAPFAEIPKENQANLEAILTHALDLGINHIETARGYGTSEMQLAPLLHKYPRQSYILQSKVAPKADPQEFLATFEETMGYLQQDYLDLFTIHGVNDHQCIQWTLNSCLQAARELQRQGRVRHVGFSSHAPARDILPLIQSGEFDFVNLHYYYVYQDTLACVQEAQRQDMGVLIISPNDKGGKLYRPSPKLAELCAPLHPMEFNSLFCLAESGVSTLSIGAAQPSDLDLHVANLARYPERQEWVARIQPKLDAAIAQEFGEDWLQSWHTGLPPYYEAPGQVNLFEILRLHTYGQALDMQEYAKTRYNMIGNSGHWFPGQKANAASPAELEACLTQHPHQKRIPGLLAQAHAAYFQPKEQRAPQNSTGNR